MDTPQIDIVRAGRLPGLAALRADDDSDASAGDTADGGLRTMVGHFSVFNAWYEIHSWWEGDFLERVAPGAFRDTFAAHWDGADPHRIKVMYDHGYDWSIGDKLLGRIKVLREDGTGGYYEVPLFDTSYNRDLIPGLEVDEESGLSEYGASFRFRVKEEHWDDEPGVSDHNPKGLPERTILATHTIEFGPTPFGASPTATAALRSLTDEFYEGLRRRSLPAFEDACRAALSAATPERSERFARLLDEISTGRAGARSTAGGDTGDEPNQADEATHQTRASAAVRQTDLALRGVIKP